MFSDNVSDVSDNAAIDAYTYTYIHIIYLPPSRSVYPSACLITVLEGWLLRCSAVVVADDADDPSW